MLEQIFASMPHLYDASASGTTAAIYFSVGEIKKTVLLSPEGCRVENGKTRHNADCVCKTSPDFFLKVWNRGYKPGMKDFLTGAIRSNDPATLQLFLHACGKD